VIEQVVDLLSQLTGICSVSERFEKFLVCGEDGVRCHSCGRVMQRRLIPKACQLPPSWGKIVSTSQ